MSRRVDLTFTAPQTWAHNALISRGSDPVTVMMPWGRGSGKSWFERVRGIWLNVLKWRGVERQKLGLDSNGKVVNFGVMRGIRIVALCPTLKQFRDIHGAALEMENAGEWAFLGGRLNRSTLRIDFPDGSWFQPMPAATASSKSGRGIRCDVVLPDEIDDIDIEVFDSVIRPWFSEGWSLKQVLGGGTPRRGRYGLLYLLHKTGISTDPNDARYLSRIATYRDSPELVDPGEVEDARRNMAPATFAREWECDFDTAEGLVFQFDEDFHVQEPPPLNQLHDFGLGIDHGWQDPGVFLLCAIQGKGEDSVLWWLDEEYASERPNSEWDAIARTRFRGLDAFPDPSRPDRILDLRRAGLKCHEVDNSIEPGIARLANLMARRKWENGPDTTRFRVSPRCVNGIRELKSYRRKKDPQDAGRFLEQIVDKNNHLIDAGRYYAMGKFGPLPSFGNYRNETPGR